MGLREDKKDRTRAQLLEAGLELIRERGFEETTVADIAAAVSVSPRTLLRYFPTKEDIIVSWVQDGMALLREQLLERLNSEPPVAALLGAARAMLADFDERSRFFLSVELTIRASRSISARKEQLIAELVDEVARLLASPDGRSPLPAIVAHAVSGTVFALIRATISVWLEQGAKAPLPDAFDEAAAVVRFRENVTR